MIYTFNISLLLSDAELESHILALGVALIREKAHTKQKLEYDHGF